MLEILQKPWPWYVAGPLIGLMVPVLLIFGNKTFGISSSLRHICAVCFPGSVSFFNYNWKKEVWNLFFAIGVVGGGAIAGWLLKNPEPMVLNPQLVEEMRVHYSISDFSNMLPADLFNWQSLLTIKGLIIIVVGGFFVGFGTRYAGGCTSGHSIMGISNLQWPSLVATCCFMIGGFVTANLILPLILTL